MSHFKAKMHRIRLLASVPLPLCPFVRLSLRWSLTFTGYKDIHKAAAPTVPQHRVHDLIVTLLYIHVSP